MRDVFFKEIYKFAKSNKDIVLLAPDFSAPSFDMFRTELDSQFINTGISEQNTALVAAGMAMNGKKVFVAAISAFLTMRCYEQVRLYAADMKLDIKLIGIGAGVSYNKTGVTHHNVEDIAIMRALPNMQILLPCTNNQTAEFAKLCCDDNLPAYVRLDRVNLPEYYENGFNYSEKGYEILKPLTEKVVIAIGYTVQIAMNVAKKLCCGVVDLYKLPIDEQTFIQDFANVKQIIIIEEHIKRGGIGSYICEVCADNNLKPNIKRFGLDLSDGLYHKYGTRDEMLEDCGLSSEYIANEVLKI